MYPADLYGCGYYRLIWPAQVLRDQGYAVSIVEPGMTSGLSIYRDPITKRLTEVLTPEGADVVVLQRPSHPHLIEAIKLLRKQGVAVVVDIDDDLAHIHPSNPAWSHMHPKSSTEHTWANVAQACKYATLVTTTTSKLVEVYGQHGRVTVLPNYVPKRFLEVPHEDASWVGWAGSTHSHPNDLQVMGQSIGNSIARGVPFRVVGCALGAGKALGLIVDPNETGNVEFQEWPIAVSKIGVGVAPLADTRFNSAKSWLKPLEYAALGVPWIGSPRAEYLRLHNLGCGIMAERTREWGRAVQSLVNDQVLREELSEKGRAVAATLTIEEHAWRWAEAWERARDIQHKE